MYRMWNWSLEGTTTAASASLAGAMWARGLFLNRACAISVNILFCLRAGVKLINRISHFLVLQFTSAIQQSCYFLPYLTYRYRFPCEEPESCSALLCLLWFYQHVRSAQLSGSPCHASNWKVLLFFFTACFLLFLCLFCSNERLALPLRPNAHKSINIP